MRLIKVILYIYIFTVLGACSAQGPIKAYDEKTVIDRSGFSILYLPPEIEIIEADGIQLDTPYIETGYNEVHIPPGEHQVAVKYAKYWGDASSGSLVASKPVIFRFKLKEKSKYYMKYKKPEDQWGAQHMVSRFSPWVEEASGSKLKTTVSHFGMQSLTSTNNTAGAKQAVTAKQPLERLKFWWENANYKEKEAFRNWLEED